MEQAYKGEEVELDIPATLTCDACEGSGAKPGTKPVTCTTCNGARYTADVLTHTLDGLTIADVLGLRSPTPPPATPTLPQARRWPAWSTSAWATSPSDNPCPPSPEENANAYVSPPASRTPPPSTRWTSPPQGCT